MEKIGIINCECMAHSLHVSVNEEFKETSIALWNYGYQNGKIGFIERLKILFDGDAFADIVVLNKDELNKLIDVLQNAREKISNS